jgi:acyl carrier protein phosphodiesterase
MNILAHLYLSGGIDHLMLGNFMGDFVKGSKYKNYPEPIKNGILLHRNIDSITDNHSSHLVSRNRFREKYGLHTGIVVDIVYDHFLAANWDQFHAMPLSVYAQQVYAYVNENFELLPDGLKQILPFMITNNWLELYKSIDGIERVLQGMARRTSMPNEVAFAIETLKYFYHPIQNEFENVMCTLIKNVNIDLVLPVFASKMRINTL